MPYFFFKADFTNSDKQTDKQMAISTITQRGNIVHKYLKVWECIFGYVSKYLKSYNRPIPFPEGVKAASKKVKPQRTSGQY